MTRISQMTPWNVTSSRIPRRHPVGSRDGHRGVVSDKMSIAPSSHTHKTRVLGAGPKPIEAALFGISAGDSLSAGGMLFSP